MSDLFHCSSLSLSLPLSLSSRHSHQTALWNGCTQVPKIQGRHGPNVNGIGYVSQVKDIRDPEPLLEELTCKQTPGEGKGESRVEGRGSEVKRKSGVAWRWRLWWGDMGYRMLWWYRMRWDQIRWDGMGWDGVGWDGMGWDEMRWNGMGLKGMGWDGMGWDGMKWVALWCDMMPSVVFWCNVIWYDAMIGLTYVAMGRDLMQCDDMIWLIWNGVVERLS